jgi:hypothetical protein
VQADSNIYFNKKKNEINSIYNIGIISYVKEGKRRRRKSRHSKAITNNK